jgi:hypothetical protein
LALREVVISFTLVKLKEICDDFALLEFVCVNLGKTFECQVRAGHVIDVDQVDHLLAHLVDGVALTGEQRSLLLLLARDFSLKADVGNPSGLLEPDLNKVLLPVVELAEEGLLDLVDVLDLHFLLFLLNVEYL